MDHEQTTGRVISLDDARKRRVVEAAVRAANDDPVEGFSTLAPLVSAAVWRRHGEGEALRASSSSLFAPRRLAGCAAVRVEAVDAGIRHVRTGDMVVFDPRWKAALDWPTDAVMVVALCDGSTLVCHFPAGSAPFLPPDTLVLGRVMQVQREIP